MKGFTWFIGKRMNGKIFYVADHDDENNAILWCRAKNQSLSFKTEASVDRFITVYLHNRTDIILIQSRDG